MTEADVRKIIQEELEPYHLIKTEYTKGNK